MRAKPTILSVGTLFFAVIVAGCTSHATATLAGQSSANYTATFGNETDRLHIVVTRGSLALSGYLEIATKNSDGKVTVRRVPITGDVSTDGVPSSIIIPSSVMGESGLTLGCFFDSSHNLELVGDNRVRYPHLMYLVK